MENIFNLPDEKEISIDKADLRDTSTPAYDLSSLVVAVFSQSVISSSATKSFNPVARNDSLHYLCLTQPL